MASSQTQPLLVFLFMALTLRESRAIVPSCLSQGAVSGRVICEDVDLTWVTAQDMTSAFQGTSGVSEIILRHCDVLPDLVFLTSAATSSLKSLTLDSLSLERPLTIDPFVQFITSLESLTFINMMDLETVDFMRFAAERETWKSLNTFTVRNCSLLSLNPDLWGFLPRVEKLIFSHNNLSSFDFGTGGFSYLVELDASYNRLSLLRDLEWKNLPSLERFYMTSNKLFDAEIIDKLPNQVVEIRLDGNSFSEITLNTAGKFDLQTLILSNNSLQRISPSFYDSNRRNLETLELDGNRGLNISELFDRLTKLKSLSLRFCYITKVDKQCQNLSSLEELDLSENWLHNIPQSTFLGSPKLRYLNLRSNRLSTLDFLEAAGAPDMVVLNSLDITDNDLSILPSFIKAPNMRHLSIKGNSLDKLSGCDYTEALIKLESFCAPALKPDSSCEYQTFIEAVQRSASKLKVYNDARCCSNPVPKNPACCMQSGTTCDSHIIKIQVPQSCPTLDILCSPTSLTTIKAITVEPVVTESPRKPFENLEGVEWFVAIFRSILILLVVTFGYILGLMILILIIYFLYREVRTDKQLRFQQDVDNEIRLDQRAHHASTKNGPSPIPHKFRAKRLNSEGSLESNSNYSECGATKYARSNPKPDSPNNFTFRGRHKFSDTKASPMKLNGSTNQQTPKNVYTAQEQQQDAASSSESLTSTSMYSYSTTPGIKSAHHEDRQLSLSVLRSKSASDIVDGPSAVLGSERPLFPLGSIQPGIGSNQQPHRIRDRGQSMTMSPIAPHPVRDLSWPDLNG